MKGAAVVLLLVVLGLVLVVAGVVVLIKYPDRPGGVLRLRDVEVSSKGAGLPLVVVGAVLVVVAVLFTPVRDPSAGGGAPETTVLTGSGEAGAPPAIPGLDVAPSTDCTSGFFAEEPAVDAARVRSVELDAVDRRVLGTGERQDVEFGLVFSDVSATEPVVLGAMKLSQRPGIGFRVSGLVDEQTCAPTGLSLADDPGVPAPAALGDYVWVSFRLRDTPYVLLLNSSNANTEVLVTLQKKV